MNSKYIDLFDTLVKAYYEGNFDDTLDTIMVCHEKSPQDTFNIITSLCGVDVKFDNNYKYVSSYIKKADLSIANLETTLAGDSIPYSSYPTFNTPDTLADALKNAGVDVVSTINNHSFDKGD